MSIYRVDLSAAVIGNNLLPIIVIAQNSFDLSITDVIYFVIAVNYRDKVFFLHTVFKLQCWRDGAVGKIHGVH